MAQNVRHHKTGMAGKFWYDQTSAFPFFVSHFNSEEASQLSAFPSRPNHWRAPSLGIVLFFQDHFSGYPDNVAARPYRILSAPQG
jgi:hypothetical protein